MPNDVEASRISDVDRDSKSLRERSKLVRSRKAMNKPRQGFSEAYLDLHQNGRVVSRANHGGICERFDFENHLGSRTEFCGSNEHPFKQSNHHNRIVAITNNEKLPTFNGYSVKLDFLDWFDMFEDYFGAVNPPDVVMCKLAASKLRGEARIWWNDLQNNRLSQGKSLITSWSRMRELLLKRFLHTSRLTWWYKKANEVDEKPSNCSSKVPSESFSSNHGQIQANLSEHKVTDDEPLMEEPQLESLEEWSTPTLKFTSKKIGSDERCDESDVKHSMDDGFVPTKCSTEFCLESNIKEHEGVVELQPLGASGLIYDNSSVGASEKSESSWFIREVTTGTNQLRGEFLVLQPLSLANRYEKESKNEDALYKDTDLGIVEKLEAETSVSRLPKTIGHNLEAVMKVIRDTKKGTVYCKNGETLIVKFDPGGKSPSDSNAVDDRAGNDELVAANLHLNNNIFALELSTAASKFRILANSIGAKSSKKLLNANVSCVTGNASFVFGPGDIMYIEVSGNVVLISLRRGLQKVVGDGRDPKVHDQELFGIHLSGCRGFHNYLSYSDIWTSGNAYFAFKNAWKSVLYAVALIVDETLMLNFDPGGNHQCRWNMSVVFSVLLAVAQGSVVLSKSLETLRHVALVVEYNPIYAINMDESGCAHNADIVKDGRHRSQIHFKTKIIDLQFGKLLILLFDPGGQCQSRVNIYEGHRCMLLHWTSMYPKVLKAQNLGLSVEAGKQKGSRIMEPVTAITFMRPEAVPCFVEKLSLRRNYGHGLWICLCTLRSMCRYGPTSVDACLTPFIKEYLYRLSLPPHSHVETVCLKCGNYSILGLFALYDHLDYHVAVAELLSSNRAYPIQWKDNHESVKPKIEDKVTSEKCRQLLSDVSVLLKYVSNTHNFQLRPFSFKLAMERLALNLVYRNGDESDHAYTVGILKDGQRRSRLHFKPKLIRMQRGKRLVLLFDPGGQGHRNVKVGEGHGPMVHQGTPSKCSNINIKNEEHSRVSLAFNRVIDVCDFKVCCWLNSTVTWCCHNLQLGSNMFPLLTPLAHRTNCVELVDSRTLQAIRITKVSIYIEFVQVLVVVCGLNIWFYELLASESSIEGYVLVIEDHSFVGKSRKDKILLLNINFYGCITDIAQCGLVNYSAKRGVVNAVKKKLSSIVRSSSVQTLLLVNVLRMRKNDVAEDKVCYRLIVEFTTFLFDPGGCPRCHCHMHGISTSLGNGSISSLCAYFDIRMQFSGHHAKHLDNCSLMPHGSLSGFIHMGELNYYFLWNHAMSLEPSSAQMSFCVYFCGVMLKLVSEAFILGFLQHQTRGRVIILKGWTEEINVNTAGRFVGVKLCGIRLFTCVNIWCDNGKLTKTLKVFYKLVNGLDPPMDVLVSLRSFNVLHSSSTLDALVDELFFLRKGDGMM